MKMILHLFVAALVFGAIAAAADTKLPPPQKTGGPALFEAIDKRSSPGQNNFPSGVLSQQDLSTILWAASGHNRDGAKWSVPMAMGRAPYCKIYLTTTEGVYLYNWKNHSLETVSTDNVHADIPIQGFAQKSPMNLYIVADGAEIAAMNNPHGEEFCAVLAGAMSQNIYLAGQGVDVGARVVYSIKREEATKKLKLGKGDKALFVIVMGKYK